MYLQTTTGVEAKSDDYLQQWCERPSAIWRFDFFPDAVSDRQDARSAKSEVLEQLFVIKRFERMTTIPKIAVSF